MTFRRTTTLFAVVVVVLALKLIRYNSSKYVNKLWLQSSVRYVVLLYAFACRVFLWLIAWRKLPISLTSTNTPLKTWCHLAVVWNGENGEKIQSNIEDSFDKSNYGSFNSFRIHSIRLINSFNIETLNFSNSALNQINLHPHIFSCVTLSVWIFSTKAD